MPRKKAVNVQPTYLHVFAESRVTPWEKGTTNWGYWGISWYRFWEGKDCLGDTEWMMVKAIERLDVWVLVPSDAFGYELICGTLLTDDILRPVPVSSHPFCRKPANAPVMPMNGPFGGRAA